MEVISHKISIEEIRKVLNADSLGYISVCGLLEALIDLLGVPLLFSFQKVLYRNANRD